MIKLKTLILENLINDIRTGYTILRDDGDGDIFPIFDYDPEDWIKMFDRGLYPFQYQFRKIGLKFFIYTINESQYFVFYKKSDAIKAIKYLRNEGYPFNFKIGPAYLYLGKDYYRNDETEKLFKILDDLLKQYHINPMDDEEI
jgi:hypothetical protein